MPILLCSITLGLVLIVLVTHHDAQLDRLHAHCDAVAVHLTDDAKLLQDAKPERRDLGRQAYFELVGGDNLELCANLSYNATTCGVSDDACLAREALGLVAELQKEGSK